MLALLLPPLLVLLMLLLLLLLLRLAVRVRQAVERDGEASGTNAC